jgi:hypothetical protein
MATDFPEIPNVEENPLNQSSHDYIMAKYRALFSDLSKASELSLILAVFRDGMLLPFSGLDAQGNPVAKNYKLPLDLGHTTYANQITTISAEPTPGVLRASSWYWQNGKRYCNGG